jgi:protein TonB
MVSVSNSQEKQEEKPKQEVPPPPPLPTPPQKEAIKPKPVVKKITPVKSPVPVKKVVQKIDIPVVERKEIAPVENTPALPSSLPSPAPVNKTIETPPPRQISSGISPLFHVLPKYPQHAANAHIEGWVRVEFTIQTDGSVDDAVVVNSQPPDVFDDAALTAIRKWEFKEKIVNGVPVTQRATQTLQFKLEN